MTAPVLDKEAQKFDRWLERYVRENGDGNETTRGNEMGYLILTRRPGEAIDLTLQTDLPKGTRLEMVVVNVDGNQVRMGIEAPVSVRIDRHEITLRRVMERNGNA